MASSDRLVKNRSGQIFIPMNVDGGVIEENFMSSGKVALLIVLLFSTFIAWVWVNGWNTGWVMKVLGHIFILYIDQLVVRKLILEENYLYKMHKKTRAHRITTPAVFWDIVNIKDTEDGAVFIYSDMKIGVILKVERDTITGKSEDFREKHYDALSDFYKELNFRKYKFIQMDIMEQAGKDPRLHKLDNLVLKEKNKNLSSLLEAQVSYIKKVTRSTLSENNYFLIYTDNVNRSDQIIQDVIDSVMILMDGGFLGFKLLSLSEVVDLVHEIYGVRYFDYAEASLNVFKNSKAVVDNPFVIREIKLTDGTFIKVGQQENNRIKALSHYIKTNDIDYATFNTLEALKGKIRYLRPAGSKDYVTSAEEVKAFEIVDKTEEVVVDLDNYAFGILGTPVNTSNSVNSANRREDNGNEGLKRKKLEVKIRLPLGGLKGKKDSTKKDDFQHKKVGSSVSNNNGQDEDEFIDF